MKMINRKILFLSILLINVILFSSIISAGYTENLGYSPAYNNLGGLGISSGISSLTIDDSMCQQGTDFIVQISPLSCEPTVVTSDLLAEENVNVFCKMTGTKINPLIDVSDINSIRFAKEYPREVVNIGYMPAQAALGYTEDNLEGSLLLDNLGYVVVTLRKQPNESALTNCEKTVFGNEVCWVQGTLTATFNYDIKNSFGVGNALFYLPLMDEGEWMDNYVRYSFWDGRGYLRAENIDEDSAVISIYSDKTVLRGILEEERRYALQKYSSNINLKVGGEESNKIYLPGLSPCLASLQLKLEGVEDPDTFVRIKVNDDYLELRDGETFLDGKCEVKDLDSKGVSEEVQIKCREDDKSSDPFYLRILPKVNLEVNEKVDSYEVGDYLYQSSDGKKFIYLGYVGVAGDEIIQDSADAKIRLYTFLVALPIHKDSLSDEEITSVARHAESLKATSGKTGTIDKLAEGFNKWVTTRVLDAGKHILGGEDFKFVPYKDSTGGTAIVYEFKGGHVALEGLSKTDNIDTLDESGDWKYVDYYQDAMGSFDTVIDSYPKEVEDSQSLQSYGELALIEEINLAHAVGQGETMLELCKQFAQDYPDSIYSPELCVNPLKFSNSKNAVKEVIINGKASDISFEGVSSPGVNEYSATLVVTNSTGQSQSFDLRKDKVVSLSSLRAEGDLKKLKVSEYIILEELDKDSAKIKISVDNHGDKKEILVDSKTLKKGASSEKFGEYTFLLTEVTLKKVAKVSITANTDFAKSNSTFNFKIGVEKRAIQLSPEKAAEKIIQINKSIKDWEKVSKTLGGVVSAGKVACIATQAVLIGKNLIANRNGGAIARQEVMTGEGGWNKICEKEMRESPKTYSSLNSCFLAHSDEIESDVNRLSSVINKQNQIIDGITSEDSAQFISKFSDSVESTVNSLTESQASGVDLTKIKEILNSESLGDKGAYTLDELKEIQIYAMYLQNTPVNTNDEFRETAIQRLNSVVADVTKNSEGYIKEENFETETGMKDNTFIDSLTDLKTKTIQISASKMILFKATKYSKYTLDDSGSQNIIKISDTDYAYATQDSNTGYKYLIRYNSDGVVVQTYNILESSLTVYKDDKGNNKPNPFNFKFQIYTAASYKNSYKSSYGSPDILLKYSGTYAYRNKPVVVPFDKKEGWYAGIKSPGTAYDASGVIREFWLCNVGEDGIEEFQLEDFGGDYCLLINTAQANEGNPFSDSVNIKQKIKDAIAAISVAQKRYKEGVTKVYINPNVGTVKVGEPLTEAPDGECTDFMSVEDCTLLFNVCDPVVCPASRCNYGGKYPVQDVIQTGVVGSLFLCYPNAKWEGGDIYVPFCISGINSGIENWITVKKDYAKCLQKSIDTGETVGICDEMYSIYLCEFFWKQAIPVAKLMGSKIIEKVIGKSSRGGGEYQSFREALKNAQNSIDYLTQYYAANSNRAFRARSTEEIGAGICGTFASVVYPDGGTFLSNLIAPDSPFQFTGKFEETQITTATNPPTSHYKVYFHIYAGTDSGAYYSVYLRGSGSSYYQDTAADRTVKSGYIARGESADEAIDFTAPSGYNKLCITVNGQEECGFKEVSTSFAVNYLSDLYVKDQATKTEIKTKEECTSGSLLDLNLEGMADKIANSLLNADIYSQGIVRTCSTNSPGTGTDPNVGKEDARWKKVGYCDDKNIGCWIDMDSVKDAIKSLDVEEDAVSDISANAMEYLSNTYYSFEEFKAKKDEIKAETNVTKKLELIKTALNSEKVFWNNQKAYLYLEEGKSYAELSIDFYKDYVDAMEELRKRQAAEEEPCDDSLVGKKILYLAQNKIGEETTRMQNGQEVYDNVCATFVSNILIDAGALPQFTSSNLDSTSERDAIVELVPMFKSGKYSEVAKSNWASGLKEGDIIIWGCQGLSYCSTKPDADEFQHITIFSKYDGAGIEIIHDPGKNGGPVAKKTYPNPFGTSWYITHVFRAACAEVTEIPEGTIEPDVDLDETYISPAIEFEDGSSTTNVCYKYFNSEWHWAIADTNRGTVFNPSCNDHRFPNGRKWFDSSVFIDEQKRQLDETSVNFVKSLKDKDYVEGIELLIRRAVAGREGIFRKDLSSYAKDSGDSKGIERDILTNMNHKGLFEVKLDSASISPLYFKNTNDEWQWSPDKDNWMSVSTKVIFGGDYNGVSVTQGVDLINSLNGDANLYEGGAILFDPTSEEVREEFGSEPGINADTSSLENNFERRDLTKLTNLMNTICGSDCNDCAKWIVEASSTSNIPDELLLLAIMIQESSCRAVESSDGQDIGLMQINLGNCGFYSLPEDKTTCKNELLTDKETNIKVGAQVLKDKYNTYKSGRTFTCASITETYSGWEAALRGYNGWTCTGDNNYVENVKTKYFELFELYGGNLPSSPASSLSEEELAELLVGFSNKEKEVITNAVICNDCGEGISNFCDEEECIAIGKKLSKTCVYISTALALGKCDNLVCTAGATKCEGTRYCVCDSNGIVWVCDFAKGKCGY